MSKFITAQNDFSAGELSPKLKGRFDVKQYAKGAQELRNFIPEKSGGIAKRPGTRYLADMSALTSVDDIFALYPFIFSTDEVYMLALTEKTSGVLGVHAYDETGTYIEEVSHLIGWTAGLDVRELSYAQSGDVLYFTHTSGTIPPFKISRIGTNTPRYVSGTFRGDQYDVPLTGQFEASIKLARRYPFLDENTDPEIKLKMSATDAYPNEGYIYSLDSSSNPIPYFEQNHDGVWHMLTKSDLSTSGTSQIDYDLETGWTYWAARTLNNSMLDAYTNTFAHTDIDIKDETFDETNVNHPLDLFEVNSHGYTTGDEVVFNVDAGVPPNPLVDTTTYWIIRINANQFKVASSEANALAGTAINITSNGSGDFQLNAVAGTGTRITITGHGRSTEDPAEFDVNGGVEPTTLTDGTTYYYIVLDANTVKLATSAVNAAAGTAIDLTAAGDGNFNMLYRDDEFDYGAAHNFSTGDEVYFEIVSGSPPPPLADDTTYYISDTGANTFKLCTSVANAIAGTGIDMCTCGTGSWTITPTKVVSAPVYFGVAHAWAPAGEESMYWREMAFSKRQGYPKTVALYQGRLIFGGTTEKPDTIYCSMVDNFDHLMQPHLAQDSAGDSSGIGYPGPLSADDAFSFYIRSNQLNAIQWMVPDRTLQLGTTGAEFVIDRQDGVYSAVSGPQVKPQGSIGGKPIAIKVFNSAAFISRDGKRLFEASYSEENGATVSRDLSILSDQIRLREATASDGHQDIVITQMVWHQSRNVLWLLTSNNTLLGITIVPSSEIIAWHWHQLGGTDVTITGMAVLPNGDNTHDDLWLAVNRTIDGSTVSYLEKVGNDFEHVNLSNSSTSSDDHPWFSDCAIRLTNGTPQTTWSGLDHLEGETVQVLADGSYVGEFTISGGDIELDTAASEVIVGLQYTAVAETMPIEAGSQIGNSQLEIGRFDKVLLKLFKSLSGEQGNGTTNLYSIEYPDVDANETFTGKVKVDFDDTPDEERTIYIKHDEPYPFNVLTIIMRGYAQD